MTSTARAQALHVGTGPAADTNTASVSHWATDWATAVSPFPGSPTPSPFPPEPGGALHTAPGGDGAPEELAAHEREFASHEPYRLRVPYQGRTEPGAPGWHYLNFASPLVPGVSIWLTAFDPPTPAPARETRNPNTALGVVGLQFDLQLEALADLSHLAGQPMTEGALRIGNVTIAATGVDSPPGEFPLRAVVLQAASLNTVRAHAPPAEETLLMGRPALRIETNPLAWDLLITA